jgi:Ulp1 family protease
MKTPADYKLPDQNNMYNCGVWVATYIKHILKEELTGIKVQWHNVSEDQVSSMRK